MSDVYIKTKIRSGHGSLQYLRNFKDRKVLIICDRFMVECGSIKLVTAALDDSNEVELFDQVVPDPTTESVGHGLSAACRMQPDVIIGFGGGSAIDTAKGVIYVVGARGLFKKPFFVTIPTTSGTGSEVTSVTVITDTEIKTKHLIASEDILADLAILDTRLTLSVPPAITANTGMDVLTHAMEAYVALDANVFSDALAEKSAELVLSSLLTCYVNGQNMEARTKTHEASTLAGIAFNTAGLGANHSIAHQLGGTFHIPHGLANAILLNEVITYNCRDRNVLEKYATLACKVNLASILDPPEYSVNVFKSAIATMMAAMKMPGTLREAGVEETLFKSQLDNMTANALKDNCMSTTPVAMQACGIKEILQKIY